MPKWAGLYTITLPDSFDRSPPWQSTLSVCDGFREPYSNTEETTVVLFFYPCFPHGRSFRPPETLSEPPQLVYKDTLTSPVSAVLTADYRMSGAAELLVVGASGEVRGYIPTVATSTVNGESLGNRKQQVCVLC